jgi:excisionase family DNA binding protein
MTTEKAALSVKEFAQVTGLSEDSAWRQIQCGHVKVFRLGRRVLVPVSELQRLLGEAAPHKPQPYPRRKKAG